MSNNIDIYLQIFHTELWPEFKYYIFHNKIEYNNLYIGLYDNQNNTIIQEEIKQYPNCYIDILPNIGGDIGNFLLQFNKYALKSDSAYFLKIHSKKSILNEAKYNTIMNPFGGIINTEWWPESVNTRADMIYKLMGNQEIFNKNIDFFSKYMDIGMVFPYYNDYGETKNSEIIKELLTKTFKIDYNSVTNTTFPAGSMFFARKNIFIKYLSSSVIKKLYSEIPVNWSVHRDGSICHALERIFGYIVTAENYRIRRI